MAAPLSRGRPIRPLCRPLARWRCAFPARTATPNTTYRTGWFPLPVDTSSAPRAIPAGSPVVRLRQRRPRTRSCTGSRRVRRMPSRPPSPSRRSRRRSHAPAPVVPLRPTGPAKPSDRPLAARPAVVSAPRVSPRLDLDPEVSPPPAVQPPPPSRFGLGLALPLLLFLAALGTYHFPGRAGRAPAGRDVGACSLWRLVRPTARADRGSSGPGSRLRGAPCWVTATKPRRCTGSP